MPEEHLGHLRGLARPGWGLKNQSAAGRKPANDLPLDFVNGQPLGLHKLFLDKTRPKGENKIGQNRAYPVYLTLFYPLASPALDPPLQSRPAAPLISAAFVLDTAQAGPGR
jgi:hypothetical protein